MIDKNELKEIRNSVYWVGNTVLKFNMQINSYLIVDEKSVLIDTASREDSKTVIDNIIKIIHPSKLNYIIITNTEPEVCSGLFFFIKEFPNAKIITAREFSVSLRTYASKFDSIFIDDINYKIDLSSKRFIEFIPAPYVNKHDSFFAYDNQENILFSSYLFSSKNKSFSLYPNENHIDDFVEFHEKYFSDLQIIKSTIKMLKKYDIDFIAPLVGSLIDKDLNIYFDMLSSIKTGKKAREIYKYNLNKEDFIELLNEINKIIIKKDNDDLYRNLLNSINEFYKYDENSLNELLEIVYNALGIEGINDLKSKLNKFIYKNNLDSSKIFYINDGIKNVDKYEEIIKENKLLKEKNKILLSQINETRQGLMVNELTNLYNGRYFINYLKDNLQHIMENNLNYSIIFIDIDDLSRINLEYGDDSGDETIKNVSLILREITTEDHEVYKMKGALFAYYIENEEDDPLEIAEKIRNSIGTSKTFIDRITVSIAIFRFIELFIYENMNYEELLDEIMNRANTRLKIVKSFGGNIVFEDALLRKIIKSKGKILICDYDNYSSKIIKNELEKLNYEVEVTDDGDKALKIIKNESILVVVTSIMIKKMDAFELKSNLNKFSAFKNIGFIISDFNKNPNTIKRAYSLDVDYYLKKPFLIEELLEIIKKIVRKSR